MDLKPLTSGQLTLIKAYHNWFIERYPSNQCKINVSGIEHKDNDRLVVLTESCKRKNLVQN